jgi:hypothetical protein
LIIYFEQKKNSVLQAKRYNMQKKTKKKTIHLLFNICNINKIYQKKIKNVFLIFLVLKKSKSDTIKALQKKKEKEESLSPQK